MTIEIKNHWTGEVIFSHECEDNTLKKTVEEAIRQQVDLSYSNLRDSNLSGSDLSGSDLSYSNLSGSDLSGSNLSGSNLRDSNLSGSDLSYSNLRCSDLRDSNLSGSNLSGSNLSYSNLSGSNLSYSNLSGSNLRGSNLSYSNLRDSEYDEGTAFFALQCPEEGEFIAWKKVKGCIVKLLIPADAQRSSATSRKCRASKAHVLAIYDNEGNEQESVVSDNYVTTTYKVGEDVLPDSWDDDRWSECSHGIHFFITRREAEIYN